MNAFQWIIAVAGAVNMTLFIWAAGNAVSRGGKHFRRNENSLGLASAILFFVWVFMVACTALGTKLFIGWAA